MLNLREIQAEAVRNATEKGFHDEDESPPSAIRQIAWMGLLYSEVSEAIDCVIEGTPNSLRQSDGKPEGLLSELADIVIRACDSAGALGIDLAAEPVSSPWAGFLGGTSMIAYLGLITSDIGKAVEAIRKGEPVGPHLRKVVNTVEFVTEETHVFGARRLAEAVDQKLAYNRTRPRLHGGKRA